MFAFRLTKLAIDLIYHMIDKRYHNYLEINQLRRKLVKLITIKTNIMKEKIEKIKEFEGRKNFYVWVFDTEVFEEINFDEFMAIARYSTCREFQWEIDIIKSSFFERLDCYLQPNWRSLKK